jgi:hypothetical protein
MEGDISNCGFRNISSGLFNHADQTRQNFVVSNRIYFTNPLRMRQIALCIEFWFAAGSHKLILPSRPVRPANSFGIRAVSFVYGSETNVLCDKSQTGYPPLFTTD